MMIVRSASRAPGMKMRSPCVQPLSLLSCSTRSGRPVVSVMKPTVMSSFVARPCAVLWRSDRSRLIPFHWPVKATVSCSVTSSEPSEWTVRSASKSRMRMERPCALAEFASAKRRRSARRIVRMRPWAARARPPRPRRTRARDSPWGRRPGSRESSRSRY
jgi:hypothetical protein